MKRSPGGTGMPALVGLLLVVFVIAGLLVYEAWNTGRQRREIAERGLQDYAAYASWSTARAGENSLSATLSTLFRGLVGNRLSPGESVAPLSQLVSGAKYLRQCDCAYDVSAEYYFRFDRRAGSLELISLPASSEARGPEPGWASAKVGSYMPVASPKTLPEESAWLQGALASITARSMAGFALFFDANGKSERVIGLAPQRDSAGRIVGALGFVTSSRSFAESMFAHLWTNPKILPYAITHGVPNDSLLAATVTTPAGTEIYRSRSWNPGLRSDTASLGTFGGGLRLRVGLRSDATARLQGDLVPASRVPVWVGLLMLTGLLTVFIVRNLQREHELARLRLEFSASVSHELRTPLAQILLFGETLTLNRTRSEAERSTAASIIVREARRLMNLVDNTLTFSRAERPVVSLSPQRVDLAPIVTAVIAGFRPLAAAREVTVTQSLDPEARSFVDPEAFAQMLLNLLDNAVKYGPSGQRVSVILSRGHTSGALPQEATAGRKTTRYSTIRLMVDDQGPGISGRGQDDIWIPFARGTNGEPPVGTGCGLGLAVVRDLAERHSGSSWVEMAPGGRGARFVIELPDSTTIDDRELAADDAISPHVEDAAIA